VLGRCTDRRTQAELVDFMEEVARAYPKGPVHGVRDNLNTHRAQAVWERFNARHGGRFVFHFTPLHASWVNQIELLFGIYSRRVLRHASHTGRWEPLSTPAADLKQTAELVATLLAPYLEH